MNKLTTLLPLIAASLTLSACVTTTGGGSSIIMSPDKITRPIRADDKPYIGERPFGMDNIQLSQMRRWFVGQPEAWTLGNFFGDGRKAMFSSQNVGSFNEYNSVPPQEIINNPKYASKFDISTIDENGKVTIELTLPGCTLARSAAAADFTKVGRDGVIVACQGFDRWDGYYPGEKMKLILPDGEKGFVVSDVGGVGFNHGVDAGDVNGDDYPDFVVADPQHNPPVYFMINQKDGTFKKDTSRIKGLTSTTGYYITKLIDIDGDGIVDLTVGGFERDTSAQPAVLFGDKDGTFGREKLVIPKVPHRDVAYDFIPVTSEGERILYVNRTSDRGSNVPLHATLTLQSVNLTTGEVKVEYDELGDNIWVPWWFPVKKDGKVGVTTYSQQTTFRKEKPPICMPHVPCNK